MNNHSIDREKHSSHKGRTGTTRKRTRRRKRYIQAASIQIVFFQRICQLSLLSCSLLTHPPTHPITLPLLHQLTQQRILLL